MSSRTAVISGASIAGLSAAFWLRRTGWEVTVLERSPTFRAGGQNVDLRGVAKDVLARMGLTETVRAATTSESGTVVLDDDAEPVGQFGSDEVVDGPTAELEVLRGDLARILLDALPAGVEVVYGETVTEVDDGSVVRVETATGRVLEADLLVICEGVRSSTRSLVFGPHPGERDLGIDMVFATIPRTPDDDDRWRWYTTTRGRQVHLRPRQSRNDPSSARLPELGRR